MKFIGLGVTCKRGGLALAVPFRMTTTFPPLVETVIWPISGMAANGSNSTVSKHGELGVIAVGQLFNTW